jgi:phenylpropionate dioxygenase-like ring-hydroxylating dioxygenase large terminal subunit
MALTPADYFSAAAFERECAGPLRRSWIPICRSEDLAAGAMRPMPVLTTPVIVARTRSGALRALSNVCRHRALTLLEAEAAGEAIRCPYHLWTYDLDGALKAAPFMDGVDLTGCDLPRYGACEWGGWVFVDLSGEAEPLADQLATLDPVFDPAELAALRPAFRIPLRHAWNWKVMVENFGESYHHIGAHAGTLQPLWPGGQTSAAPSTARWIDLRHPVHPVAGELRVLVVFPLLLIALTPASGAATWYRLNPTGPEEIELEIVGLHPPEALADAEATERARTTLWAIHQEDIPMCERTQAGLKSPDAVLGPLSPLEAGLARFREWLSGDR